MAERKPLVMISGEQQELPAGDTLPPDPATQAALDGKFTDRTFQTSETGGSDGGKFTLIATATISAYLDQTRTWMIWSEMKHQLQRGTVFVDWFVKQQNAFGGDPVVQVDVRNEGVGTLVDTSDLIAVIVQNTGPTIVELWWKVGTYEQIEILPVTTVTRGTATIAYHAGQTLGSAPTPGTQVVGRNPVIRLATKAGIPADGDFPTTPPDGTAIVNTANNRLYVRTGGSWRYTSLT